MKYLKQLTMFYKSTLFLIRCSSLTFDISIHILLINLTQGTIKEIAVSSTFKIILIMLRITLKPRWNDQRYVVKTTETMICFIAKDPWTVWDQATVVVHCTKLKWTERALETSSKSRWSKVYSSKILTFLDPCSVAPNYLNEKI